jgi:hypothetical protein
MGARVTWEAFGRLLSYLTEVISWHLPEAIEENHDNPQSG